MISIKLIWTNVVFARIEFHYFIGTNQLYWKFPKNNRNSKSCKDLWIRNRDKRGTERQPAHVPLRHLGCATWSRGPLGHRLMLPFGLYFSSWWKTPNMEMQILFTRQSRCHLGSSPGEPISRLVLACKEGNRLCRHHLLIYSKTSCSLIHVWVIFLL